MVVASTASGATGFFNDFFTAGNNNVFIPAEKSRARISESQSAKKGVPKGTARELP